KTRVIAHSQQVVRIDHERRNRLSDNATAELYAIVEKLATKADAILLSDYQKGVLDPELLRACVRLGGGSKPVTGNLKPNALGPHASLTCLTLNLLEAKVATGNATLETDEEIRAAGKTLLEMTGSGNVLVTRGADGLTLFSASSPDAPVHVPARPVAVYD